MPNAEYTTTGMAAHQQLAADWLHPIPPLANLDRW